MKLTKYNSLTFRLLVGRRRRRRKQRMYTTLGIGVGIRNKKIEAQNINGVRGLCHIRPTLRPYYIVLVSWNRFIRVKILKIVLTFKSNDTAAEIPLKDVSSKYLSEKCPIKTLSRIWVIEWSYRDNTNKQNRRGKWILVPWEARFLTFEVSLVLKITVKKSKNRALLNIKYFTKF